MAVNKRQNTKDLTRDLLVAEDIARTLQIAYQFGGSDEVDHLKWAIDQMIRSLLGCQPVENNDEFPGLYALPLGESDKYRQWVDSFNKVGDSPVYEWDAGIAP